MKVTVRYAAQAREAAGTASETVELEGSSVRDLLRRLAERHGNIFLHPSTLVFVRDEMVRGARELKPGDEVSIMTPISGG